MRDISLKRSEILDPPGKKYWPFYKGRDGCRSPMQWDDTVNAGFSSKRPWLPVHPNHRVRNVEAQQADSKSMLNFTRDIIKLRREKPALHRGDFALITTQPKDALVYLRKAENQTILVALNFKNRNTSTENVPAGKWNLLYSTHRESVPERTQQIKLAPYEVLILESA